jgi:hypothetical protein
MLLVEVLGEADLPLQNVLVDDHRVLVGEGVDARVHLVYQDAQSPPVDASSVPLVQQYFGSEVFGRATESVGPGFDYFGETEICQLEVAVLSDQQVLGF